MTSASEFWYITRAAGLTAYLLLTVSVVLGLLLASKDVRGLARTVAFDAHRVTALAALLFTAGHALALVGDTYIDFGLREILVPLASPYRPWQVAVGVLSFYALAATLGAFYFRNVIGQRAWRMLHMVSLLAYAGATVHGVTAGSDTGEGWTTAIYALSAAAVMIGVLIAVVEPVLRRVTSPAFARVPSALAAVAMAGFAIGLVLSSRGGAEPSLLASAPAGEPARVGLAASLEQWDDDEHEDFDDDEWEHDEHEDDDESDEHEDEDGDDDEHEEDGEHDDDDDDDHEEDDD